MCEEKSMKYDAIPEKELRCNQKGQSFCTNFAQLQPLQTGRKSRNTATIKYEIM